MEAKIYIFEILKLMKIWRNNVFMKIIIIIRARLTIFNVGKMLLKMFFKNSCITITFENFSVTFLMAIDLLDSLNITCSKHTLLLVQCTYFLTLLHKKRSQMSLVCGGLVTLLTEIHVLIQNLNYELTTNIPLKI